jgi:hypothetical protein
MACLEHSQTPRPRREAARARTLVAVSGTQTGAGNGGIRTLMRRALSLYRARFRLYIALVALPIIPVGSAIVALAAAAPNPGSASDRVTGIDFAAQFLLVAPIAQATVAYAVVAQLDGRALSLGEVLRAVLPRWSVLVGTVILSAIAILLGLVALVLPGLVMAIWFQFVGQVVILENGSYLAALRRCRELVRGVFWRTLGQLIVIGLISGAVTFLLALVVAGLLHPADASDRSRLVIPLVAKLPALVLGLPFSTIAVTLVYLQLRARRPPP